MENKKNVVKPRFYALKKGYEPRLFLLPLLSAFRNRGPPSINLNEKNELIGGKMKQGKIKNRNRNNPYKLGFDESRNTYTVEFKDSRKITHIVEITEKVYEAFDLFELEDISQ